MRVSLWCGRVAATVVSISLAGLALGGAGSSATPRAPLPRLLCGWWFFTQAESENVAYPDTNVGYWTTPFVAVPGLKMVIKGQFPNARYASFTVYNNAGGTFTRNGVASGIADYKIAPDPGSTNPFQHATTRPGQFTLTIQRHVSPAQVNVLPMVPASPSEGIFPPGVGFIIYRVYLPHGGSFSSVRLPTISVSHQGRTRPLPVCPWLGTTQPPPRLISAFLDGIRAQLDRLPTVPGPQLKFFRPDLALTNAFFPTLDQAYVGALFHPTPGTVVVVRGKAATAPHGTRPTPWPNPSYNLRYWSLCNNENVPPAPVVVITDPHTGRRIHGCAQDQNTRLVGGHYTFVLSSLADRPRNPTPRNGITWLPYSSRNVENLLIFRNLLGGAFPHSAQRVPPNGNPASARSVMGPYYPRIAQCSARTFARGGVPACFAVAPPPPRVTG